MFTDEHLSKTTHLVGVCGVGMTALAELLDGLGWPLSGSDLSPATESVEELIRRGLIFYQGHGVSNVHQGIQRLVYSPAVEASNPERMEAARRGIQPNGGLADENTPGDLHRGDAWKKYHDGNDWLDSDAGRPRSVGVDRSVSEWPGEICIENGPRG